MLRDSNALVTGAGHRLGRAIALALAERGARVVVHFRSARDEAAKTVSLCAKHTPGAIALGADLSDAEQATDLFRQADERLGGLDCLVNSAALFAKTPVAELTDETFSRIVDLNLTAAARCIRLARPQMARRGSGAVVNITDALIRQPYPGFGPYVAAKAGLEALTRTWALELAPAIRVNAVGPGIVLPPPDEPAEVTARWAKRIPLGRLGRPEEVAQAVCFLLEADYITGQVLAVDGGYALARK